MLPWSLSKNPLLHKGLIAEGEFLRLPLVQRLAWMGT